MLVPKNNTAKRVQTFQSHRPRYASGFAETKPCTIYAHFQGHNRCLLSSIRIQPSSPGCGKTSLRTSACSAVRRFVDILHGSQSSQHPMPRVALLDALSHMVCNGLLEFLQISTDTCLLPRSKTRSDLVLPLEDSHYGFFGLKRPLHSGLLTWKWMAWLLEGYFPFRRFSASMLSRILRPRLEA